MLASLAHVPITVQLKSKPQFHSYSVNNRGNKDRQDHLITVSMLLLKN